MPDQPYTITLTLTVSDADGDGVWVVTDDRSTEYGDGDSPAHAVADYLSAFSDEMYRVRYMDDLGTTLSPFAREELGRLKIWAEGRER